MALLQLGANLDLPTVQLLHRLADGSQHVDWMIARDHNPDAVLLTFRLPKRLESIVADEQLSLAQLNDHRRIYLDYEGPIAGGRGHVKRLSAGTVLNCDGSNEALRVHVRWEEVESHVLLLQQNSREWLLKCVSPAAAFGNNE